MIFKEPKDFKGHLPAGAIVALDYSSSVIGCAVSDVSRTIASPLCTIKNPGHQKIYATLAPHLMDRQIAGWIFGWPLDFQGIEGANCPSIQRCAEALSTQSNIPALLFDERFTTKIALSLTSPFQKTAKKEKKTNDQIAASVLLSSFLDFY